MIHKLKAAWQSVANFWGTLLNERDPDDPTKFKRKERIGLGGWLCAAFRTVGAVIFVASPLCLTLPFLMGTSWAWTIVLMATAQWVGFQFMAFYKSWITATAWVKSIFHVLKKRRGAWAEVMA